MRSTFLGEAVDLGIDAVIVQDVGLVRLIQRVYPELEIHGSTQMTVHDESGARRHARARRRARRARPREHARRHPRDSRRRAVARARDVHPRRALHLVLRAVLHVRHDLRAQRQPRFVRAVVPEGLRAHRRLDARASSIAAISSRRKTSARTIIWRRSRTPASSASRSRDGRSGRSTSRLSQNPIASSLIASSRATRRRRPKRTSQPLVQIYSRGFTGGMYGGREGRGLRDAHAARQSRHHARHRRRIHVGRRVGGELIVDVSRADRGRRRSRLRGAGCTSVVRRWASASPAVRTISSNGRSRQAIQTRTQCRRGLARRAHVRGAAARAGARELRRALIRDSSRRKRGSTSGCSARPGTPLKAVFTSDGESVTVRCEVTLSVARASVRSTSRRCASISVDSARRRSSSATST